MSECQLTQEQRDAITKAALDYCRYHGEPGDEAWSHYKQLWGACHPKPPEPDQGIKFEVTPETSYLLSEQQYRDFVRMLAWWSEQGAELPNPVARECTVEWGGGAKTICSGVNIGEAKYDKIDRVLVDGVRVWPPKP